MLTREERKTSQPGLGAVSLSKCLGGEELRGKQHRWVCGPWGRPEAGGGQPVALGPARSSRSPA